MKKSVKSLLIMLAVLVVLGGAAACLLLFPAESGGEGEASSPAASEEPKETLVQMEEEDLASILVENSQGSFEIMPVPPEETGKAESGMAEAAYTYTIKGLESYSLDKARLQNAAGGGCFP